MNNQTLKQAKSARKDLDLKNKKIEISLLTCQMLFGNKWNLGDCEEFQSKLEYDFILLKEDFLHCFYPGCLKEFMELPEASDVHKGSS